MHLGSKVLVSFSKPTIALDLNVDLEIDTDNSTLCDVATPDKCVIAYTSVKIESGHVLRAKGSRPLVIVSLSNVEILGTIDVSSRAGFAGAGANPPTCVVDTAVGAAGGTGGSFSGHGGAGSAPSTTVAVEPSLLLSALSPSTDLRGGCPGQSGGPGQTAGAGGRGGEGGGAVDIVASTIDVEGQVNASGEGGQGGGAQGQSGGGGGGTGGMIVLDVPSNGDVTVQGRGELWANGGGGGQGGAAGSAGAAGSVSLSPNASAAGASSNSAGADGGAGSVGNALFGSDAPSNARPGGGGGGGGGGAGLILGINTSDLTKVSPPGQ